MSVDLTRAKKHNQKREVSYGVYTIGYLDLANAGGGADVANLPAGCFIKSITSIKNGITPSTAAVTVSVGGTSIAAAKVIGVDGIVVPAIVNLPVGGKLNILGGLTTEAATAGEVTVIIEYVEYNKTCGEFTN